MKIIFVLFIVGLAISFLWRLSRKAATPKVPQISSKVNYNHLADNSDPYLWFIGPIGGFTPKEFIVLLDTIRKKSEFERLLGESLKVDKQGRFEPIMRNACFSFCVIRHPDGEHLEAIKTGKKWITSPGKVAHYIVNFGCTFDHFIDLPPDVIHYCNARVFLKEGKFDQALKEAKAAARVNPKENLYHVFVGELRLKSGDLSSIDDELKRNANDMDCMIHSGKTTKWLRALIQSKKYSKAVNLIKTVIAAMDDLIIGKSKNRIYGAKSKEYYESKKKQYTKNLIKDVGFSSLNQILDEHEPTEDFVEFCRQIMTIETSKSRIFIERIGDAFQKWGRNQIALEFLKKALEYSRDEQKPNITDRIHKKIAKIQT